MKRKTRVEWNYEETVAEIETILQHLESGELSLEEVFAQFEIATHYWQECDRFLESGRKRMELAIEMLNGESSPSIQNEL